MSVNPSVFLVPHFAKKSTIIDRYQPIKICRLNKPKTSRNQPNHRPNHQPHHQPILQHIKPPIINPFCCFNLLWLSHPRLGLAQSRCLAASVSAEGLALELLARGAGQPLRGSVDRCGFRYGVVRYPSMISIKFYQSIIVVM